jgi:cytosine/adenosine deaminase-related metal-dependent hydrolase
MPEWTSKLLSLRRTRTEDPRDPIVEAVREARTLGTSLVGDVTNTLASYAPLVASPLSAAVFYEQIGFKADAPEARAAAAQATLDALRPGPRLRASVVPHATYSVSPDLLREIGRLGRGIISIHLGESAEELQFLRDGSGRWRRLLESLGVWEDRWSPPRCGPVEYIARAGLVSDRLVAVHAVQLTDSELSQLAAANAAIVTCPRSNAWTGAGVPPLARFYASGARVAVGTDSLASVDDLNMFSELAAMRAAAPTVPASRLLESATRAGADALGFGGELGSIEPGKRAELIAVRVPEAIEDVEEYLVGGIRPADISWLGDD